MPTSMTVQEWQAALAAAERTEPVEGWSSTEIAAILSLSKHRAGELLRDWVRDGQWEFAGRMRKPRIDGSFYPTPVYRPIVTKEGCDV